MSTKYLDFHTQGATGTSALWPCQWIEVVKASFWEMSWYRAPVTRFGEVFRPVTTQLCVKQTEMPTKTKQQGHRESRLLSKEKDRAIKQIHV